MEGKLLAKNLARLEAQLGDVTADLRMLLEEGSDADDVAFARARVADAQAGYRRLLGELGGPQRVEAEGLLAAGFAEVDRLVGRLPKF